MRGDGLYLNVGANPKQPIDDQTALIRATVALRRAPGRAVLVNGDQAVQLRPRRAGDGDAAAGRGAQGRLPDRSCRVKPPDIAMNAAPRAIAFVSDRAVGAGPRADRRRAGVGLVAVPHAQADAADARDRSDGGAHAPRRAGPRRRRLPPPVPPQHDAALAGRRRRARRPRPRPTRRPPRKPQADKAAAEQGCKPTRRPRRRLKRTRQPPRKPQRIRRQPRRPQREGRGRGKAEAERVAAAKAEAERKAQAGRTQGAGAGAGARAAARRTCAHSCRPKSIWTPWSRARRRPSIWR